jgi:translation initiation factor IF-2
MQFVYVSALTGKGRRTVERDHSQAEVMELTAEAGWSGTVSSSNRGLTGRGPVMTVLVQNGAAAAGR